MAKTISKEVNAGVHTNIGMDFQKNCALFLFLEKYPTIIETRYFIILEHYDDIVFGYLNSEEKVERIETYQAKKSSGEWKITHLFEILKKIIANALLLKKDDVEKTNDYAQSHYFTTNQPILIKATIKKKIYEKLINDSDSTVEFKSISKELQDHITKKLLKENNFLNNEYDELENFTFKYIDLSRKSSSQKEQLIGMFQTVFGDKVIDHKAALETLFTIFHSVETTLNQGNVAKLSDKAKRIESTVINTIINVITTKKKAFDLWRKKTDEISSQLQIPVLDQRHFKLHFENSFDKIKDLKEMEHQKIYQFVKSKKFEFGKFFKDEECLGFLLTSFKSNNNTQLGDIQLKSVIYAAYIEIIETK